MTDSKKMFDKEYATQYPLEVAFLKEQGIKYTFVKVINGITVYKFAKSERLFMVLQEFYKGR